MALVLGFAVACDGSDDDANGSPDASADVSDAATDAGESSDDAAIDDASVPGDAGLDSSVLDATLPDATADATSGDASTPDANMRVPDATTTPDSSAGDDEDAAADASEDAAPPDPGVTVACSGLTQGVERDCGWHFSRNITCTPGEPTTVGCNAVAGCAVGWCSGDTILRLCEGSNAYCTSAEALGQNDDSCETSCSLATVDCPAQGKITVLTGAYNSASSYTCNVSVSP
jgi:hypothetical protein